MVLRFVVACALTAAAMGMTPPTAMADPDCPVTDPPVINRCGPDPEPSPDPPPPGTRVAMCQDGDISFTQHTYRQGTCAKHGGVAQWLTDN